MKKSDKMSSGMADEIFSEVDILLAEEQAQSLSARKFEDFIGGHDVASVEDFAQKVYELVDSYMEMNVALSFVDELNKYVVETGSIKSDILNKLGKTSNLYRDISYVDSYICSTDPRVTTIWEVKEVSADIFDTIVKIACRNSKSILKNSAMVRMALLRFYVVNLLNEVVETSKLKDNNNIDCIKAVYNISASVKEMDFCWSLNQSKILSKYHSVGARSNKVQRDSKRHEKLASIANEAWKFGCELLHTQLLNLFIITGMAKENDRIGIKNKLNEIAHRDRTFGHGAIKIIDACPCARQSGCPLILKVEMKKRYSLPV